jgi:hypothetical protein
MSGQSIPSGAALETVILHHDSLFWAAYNACDLDAMMSFVDKDVEFYHDKGGRLDGAANLKEAMKRGLCTGDQNRTERRPVAETIKVFPLAGVGAILRGQHTFHSTVSADDQDIAYFFHLWVLKPEGWITTRIFSYDHVPYPANE